MEKKRSCNVLKFGAVITIIALLFSIETAAQTIADSKVGIETEDAPKKRNGIDKIKKFTLKTVDFVDRLLNTIDTTYVADNLYNMTIMPEHSFNYEHYSFSTTGRQRQSLRIAPDSYNKLTFNIGWRWIILGYGIDFQKSKPEKDIKLSLLSPRVGLDLFYRKSNEEYKIKNLKGFYNNDRPIENNNKKFDGLAIKQIGFNLYYVFNKRFSYPAAYRQSTIQRASAGSFILGAGYNRQELTFDHNCLDPEIELQLKEELKFNNIRYNNFCINLGYSYNWVFARNFLANIALTPSVGYKHILIEKTERDRLHSGINFDLSTRAAMVYNNGKYYAGISLVGYSYYYKEKTLAVINGFGTLKTFIGFYFWKKK
ncbi:MAG: DUF4421 domain-containing protein [Bacteroidaceae bacterium]|nr:DUF4421 domain-containing protein [Bacteroidaceae bacterium]